MRRTNAGRGPGRRAAPPASLLSTAVSSALPSGEEYSDALALPPPGQRPLKSGIAVLDHVNRGRIVGSRADMALWATGQFAYVFRCEILASDGGGAIAVRCLRLPPPADSAERTAAHIRFFSQHPSPYFVTISYHTDGIFVANRWRPLYLMGWAEGETLWTAIRRLAQARNQQELNRIADAWDKLVTDLRTLGVAHGDLHPDNILVAPGSNALRLVDYDTLYVPELAGRECSAVGAPGYVHPFHLRARDPQPRTFGPDLDIFGAAVIAFSLRVLAAEPQLWGRWTSEQLLLPPEALAQPDAGAGRIGEAWQYLLKHRDAAIASQARALRERCLLSPTASTIIQTVSTGTLPSSALSYSPLRADGTQVRKKETVVPSSAPDARAPDSELPAYRPFRSASQRGGEAAPSSLPSPVAENDSILPPHRRFRSAAEREGGKPS